MINFQLRCVTMFGNSFGSKQPPSIAIFGLNWSRPPLLMLFILRRITQNSQIRFYSTAAARSIPKSSSPIEQLEQHGARILRIVQKRVEERANLLSQMSDDMSSPEDIKSLRQAKELEPLKMAWDNWQTNRQVRAIFLFFCIYMNRFRLRCVLSQ